MIWFDGRIVPASDFRISATAEGLLYGLGLFETTRTFAAGPWLWDRHLQRLRRGAAELDLDLSKTELPSEKDVASLVAACGTEEAVVRLNAAAGEPGEPAIVWMTTRPIPERRSGVRLIVESASLHREAATTRNKSLNYAERRLALRRARRADADDAVLLVDGWIAETTSANVLFGTEGCWWTPNDRAGLLAGCVRAVLLEAGVLREWPETVSLESLKAANGVLLANSLRGLERVVRIGPAEIGPAREIEPLRAALLATLPEPTSEWATVLGG